MSVLPYFVAGWIFVVGLYAMATSRHFVHLLLSLAVVQTSTYVLILAIGYKTGATAPIFADIPVGTPATDPVTHALMLTDIVVEATVIALLLAITVQIHRKTGKADPDHVDLRKG